MRDYQESVTTRQTDGQTAGETDRQTDARQSDPYVPLCFTGDTKKGNVTRNRYAKLKNIKVLTIQVLFIREDFIFPIIREFIDTRKKILANNF